MKLFGGKQTGGHCPQERGALEQTAGEPLQRAAPKRPGRVRALPVALGLILFAVAAATAAMRLLPRVGEETEGESPTASLRPAVETAHVIATPPVSPAPEDPTETPTETEALPTRKEDCFTLALMVKNPSGVNTDTVMILRFDIGEQTLNFVSLPRDTLVNVNWDVKKLNTVYTFEESDPTRLNDHLSGLLGFRVDNYAVLDLWTVAALIDTVGGVSYNVPLDMQYDDPAQDLHIHIPAGLRWLSGDEAVKVFRYRMNNDGTGYPDGDLGRIRTQQELLDAILEQLLCYERIPNLERVIDLFLEGSDTDLTAGNLLYFAEAFQTLDAEDLRFDTAPGEVVYIRGGSYYQLEPEAWTELVNEALNPWSAPVTVDRLDVLREFGENGAVSTTGTVIPLEEFFNYYDYTG